MEGKRTGSSKEAKRNNPREVFLRVVFTKIGEIDTSKECFTAEVIIQAKWREQALDGITYNDEINFDDLWKPMLNVTNLITEHKDNEIYTISFLNDDERAYVVAQRFLKGVFVENLELEEFPFDIQDISVTVSSELSTSEIILLEDDELPSAINTRSFVDEQEWRLWPLVRVETGQSEDIIIGNRYIGKKHPYMIFKCTAERRYQYFLWNVIFIVMLICLLSFVIFAVDYKLIQNRLQLTCLLLLTSISFRNNINSQLPKVPYLTLLDTYLLGSWVMLCSMNLWHGIAGYFLENTRSMSIVDKVVALFFFIGCLIFHLRYFIYVNGKMTQKRNITKILTESASTGNVKLSIPTT